MTQHDYVVANASGAVVRADVNDVLGAIVTMNAGTAAPGTTFANELWADTTNSLLKKRNNANAAWVTFANLDMSQLLMNAGTKTAPAYSFSTDVDTGLYSLGANNLGISVGDTKIFDITTTAVGITGTLTSSGALVTTAGGHTITAGGLTVTAGNSGFGAAPDTNIRLYLTGSIGTGTSQYGQWITPTGSSAATTTITGLYVDPATAAAAFTCVTARGIWVDNFTKGAGSAITNQYGVFVDEQSQGTNNYGYYGGVSSGAAKFNLYMAGTASNYFTGRMLMGQAASDLTEATSQVEIKGNGYTLYQWLDGTAAYIGQNSASRELRMYSGATPTTGVKLTNGATAWASTSSILLKDIIEPITNAVEKVMAARHVIGKYKTDPVEMRRSFLIAEDYSTALPEALCVGSDGVLNLAYTEVMPLHGAAIAELGLRMAELEAQVATLH